MSTLAKLLMGVGGESADLVPVGSPFGGGFYAGRIMVGGQAYALVVSPKAQGEVNALQWKTVQTATVGTDSRNDGWSNTQAMSSAAYPAAAFCRGLNINGYDDWYLPSQDELEILYRAFKPSTLNNDTSSGENPSAIPPTGNYTISNPSQTNVEVFKQGGGEDFAGLRYWSSTQSSSTDSWVQYFSNGAQSTMVKTGTTRVRAVRRVAI